MSSENDKGSESLEDSQAPEKKTTPDNKTVENAQEDDDDLSLFGDPAGAEEEATPQVKNKVADKKLSAEQEKNQNEDDDDESLFGGAASEPDNKDNESDSSSVNSRKKKRLRKGGHNTDTKELKDGEFIDSDDDNPDIRDEYANQREYESDVDPFGDDNREEVVEEEKNGEETEFDHVLKRLKNRGKKKSDGMTEEQREEFVETLLKKMDAAHLADLESRRKGKPGLNKLKMLNDVVLALSKSSLQILFLEKNLLEVLGEWLRPSVVDGSLPDLTIRNRIYAILFKLPIERDHLARAKFGRLISYLKDCNKETQFNREKLKKLIHNWARMIFGKTDNFRMLEQMQTESQNARPMKRPRQRTAERGATKDILKSKAAQVATTDGVKAKYRAQIPLPRDFQFKNRVSGEFSSPIKASTPKTIKHEKLQKNLRKRKVIKK